MKEEEIRKKEKFDRYLQLVANDVKTFFKDTSSFEKINCPACGSNRLSNQFKKLGFIYQQCDECKTLFVNPRPQHKDLVKFYSNSISATYWINEFFKPVEKIRTEKIFYPRAEWVANYFREGVRNWTIGDIGAGFGIFLQELRKHWGNNKYIAIEPSREQCDICKSKELNFICSAVEDIKNTDNTFDFLTSFELFEHLQNPAHFLESVHKLLKHHGYFLFTTLNGQGFDIQVLWEKSKSVSPPHHLNFFNTQSIVILLEKYNFRVVKVSTPGKLDWDIVENMVRKDGVDVGRFWKLVSDINDEKMKQEFQNWIVSNNLSSHMCIIVQKV